VAFKRRAEPTTVEDEREALQAQHAALEALKRELAERVSAVRERELELHHRLSEAGGPLPGEPILPAPVHADTSENAFQLERRERALAEREQDIAARERDLQLRAEQLASLPPSDPDAAQLEQLELRLAELREAEKLFLRTRDELAGRSEAVAARERLVGQRERELDDREDGKGQWARPELSEMESRLRRLEQQQPGEQTLGFSGGLRKLEQGTRPQRGG
jgi:chromosome segregation ATPase